MAEDSVIIEMFFGRNERAVEETQKKYGEYIKAIALNILNYEEDAAECVNDAYLGVWNSIPPARPNSLQAYICAIVRRLSIRRYHYETAKKRNSTYDEVLDELANGISCEETVEQALDAKMLTAVLNEFLETLKKNDRVMFMRRYWFSESVSEIATRFGVSAHAVSVRLSRIREALRKFLMKRGIMV